MPYQHLQKLAQSDRLLRNVDSTSSWASLVSRILEHNRIIDSKTAIVMFDEIQPQY